MLASIGSGIVEGFVIALVAVGFTMIFNATGVINFANGQMMTLGAYIGWVLFGTMGWPFLAAAVIAAAAGAALGMVADRIVIAPLRQSGLLVQVTGLVALASVLDGAFTWIFGPTAKNIPPYLSIAAFIPGLNWSQMDIAIMLATVVVVGALVGFLYRTDIGLRMRAAADNPLGASLVGVSPRNIALGAWALGGGLAALGGILIFPKLILDPNLGLSLSFLAFAAVVLGGVGSLTGSIVGGLLLGVGQAVVASVYTGGFEPLVSLLIMVLVLSLRPNGIVGARA